MFDSIFHTTKKQPFTALVCTVCLLLYLLWLTPYQEALFLLAHYPAEAGEERQGWRYLSHTLIHLSEWHILFNLLWWWQFAGLIERGLGSGKLIAIYLVAGAATGFAQNMVSGPLFFGLSGVVYAVLTYVFAVDRFSRIRPLNLPDGFFYSLLIGIGIGFVSPLFGVHMGNTAHISGLIIGLIWGLIDIKRLQP